MQIRTDKQGSAAHYVEDGARKKACGSLQALCGTETDTDSSETAVNCSRCMHALDLGVHLIKESKKAK